MKATKHALSALVVLLVLTLSKCQSCSPKFLLAETLQDTITIYSANVLTTPTKSSGVFTYNYFTELFQGIPQIIISITNFQCDQFDQISYDAKALSAAKSIDFQFETLGMNWKLAQIQFLIFSRKDLFVQLTILQNIQEGSPHEDSFVISSSLAASNSIRFHSFITGITIQKSPSYNYQVKSGVLSGNVYTYSILTTSNPIKTVKVETVYFDMKADAFASAADQKTLDSVKGTRYAFLYADFAPIIYKMYGFNGLSISNQKSIHLSLSYSFTSNIIEISSSQLLQNLHLVYFAISLQPTEICAPCDSFIMISGCLDKCPKDTYEYRFQNGGKTCRKCSLELGQTLNSDSTGCVCGSGLTFYKGGCEPSEGKVETQKSSCQAFESLVDGECVNTIQLFGCSDKNSQPNSISTECVCKDNFEKVNDKCQEECSQSSLRNPQNGLCECKEGYQKIEQVCLPKCPENSVREGKTISCNCKEGFELFSGQCLQKCPSMTQRNAEGICQCNPGYLLNNLKQCESICQSDTIYDEKSKSCICKDGYELVSGTCQKCKDNQFFNPVNRKCVLLSQGNNPTIGISNISCKQNQMIKNGVCICDESKCVKCQEGTYKNNLLNACRPCINACKKCKGEIDCEACLDGFSFSARNECEEVCGDGRKFILQCDDGNKIDGDGCSSTCTIEEGFKCQGGSHISKDNCFRQNGSGKSLSIAQQPNSPLYTAPGIITTFKIIPIEQKKTTQEIQQMFSIEFSDQKLWPLRIYLSQNQEDYSLFNCFFEYGNALPYIPFSVKYDVSDSNYGLADISIHYDTINNPIKSALFSSSSDDFLT